MRLLLDTCTFLWIVGGAKELSPRAREAFADPANEAFLSAASAWESVGLPARALRCSSESAAVIGVSM